MPAVTKPAKVASELANESHDQHHAHQKTHHEATQQKKLTTTPRIADVAKR
jgi:hypothetical protein